MRGRMDSMERFIFRSLVFSLFFHLFHGYHSLGKLNQGEVVIGRCISDSSFRRSFEGCCRYSSRLFSSYSSPSPSGLYLERMVERKKIEVNQLLKRHEKPDDPIFMRMTYMASENKYNVTRYDILLFTPAFHVPRSSVHHATYPL